MANRDEQIRELLGEIQWSRSGHCPICGFFTTYGHDKYCELGQAIALLKEQPDELDELLSGLHWQPSYTHNLFKKVIKKMYKRLLLEQFFDEFAMYLASKALLKEQPCKTCGGSGGVKRYTGGGVSCDPLTYKDIPCPDCQEKKGE